MEYKENLVLTNFKTIPTMQRMRSKSVDVQPTQSFASWSKSLLCGTVSGGGRSSTFYSRSSEEECEAAETESQKKIHKICESLKKPFQKRKLSLRLSAGPLLSRKTKEPVLFTATAIRDNVPHPYDSLGLPFTRGDRIHVTRVTDHGVWSGSCNGRTGNFKFVDVEKDDAKVRKDKSKSYPELQKLCLRSKSVSDLLSSINQETLIPKFILNGFDTTESLKNMTDDDLDYLGVTDDKTKDLILGTIDWLSVCGNKSEEVSDEGSRVSDSGYFSSAASAASSENIPSNNIHVRNSFLHRQLSRSLNTLLVVTPL